MWCKLRLTQQIEDFFRIFILWQIYLIWFTHVLPVTVAPPLETLLTRFRKLQPPPLEVGDHLILQNAHLLSTI